MKNLKLLILAILISVSSYSQDWITLGIYQDVKLATTRDSHGNDPFTTDIIIRNEWQSYQINNFFVAVQISYEHADLYGGAYDRFSGGLSMTFNKMFIDNLNISYFANWGRIVRWDRAFKSAEVGIDISYRLRKDTRVRGRSKYRISLLMSLTNRNDLQWRWEEGKNHWTPNVYIGIVRDIFNHWD